MTEIPLADQYFVEKDRNMKFLSLSVMVSILLPCLHGLLFMWIPWMLMHKRDPATLHYKPYFAFVRRWHSFTKAFPVSIGKKKFYVQPSLLLLVMFHIGVNSWFCIAETRDITYEDWSYIVSKRVGRISVAHVPMILLFVAKNNVVAALSGLSLDKSVFFHKWLGRSMLISAIIHMYLSLDYWLRLKFYIMIKIPPQIFGFIAISCLGMLNFASFRFIRNFAFEFFLAQHRVFNFIMLLLAYFHNGGNHATILISVHMLVLDRIVGRVLGVLHKLKGPTKGLCDFEILDESTVRVSIPITTKDSDNHKWWWLLVPRYGNWRAGQNVLFNCNKIAFLAYHPFTISSLAESGTMVLVIKVHKGFTKKLYQKLEKLQEEADSESTLSVLDEIDSNHSDDTIDSATQLHTAKTDLNILAQGPVKKFSKMISDFVSPPIFTLKAGINGPYGANYQPLTKFDTVLFFSAGSGASFTLPVALDLLKTLKERDEANDYLYRPQRTKITIVMALKKRANLQWYDHLWPEFVPFLNSGKAHLALHITQEVSDASDEQESISPKEESSELTAKLQDTHSETESVAETLGDGGFSVTYGRPNFDSIIGDSIRSLCSDSYRKAFACVGCGTGAFNKEMKRCCQDGRGVAHAPDIYCYDESFE